ncbi:MAG: endonuclease [Flavobacteriales bacterium]|nr:endonuclease [Flavobacteriales bacterium]
MLRTPIAAQITVHSEDFTSGLGSWSQVSITDAGDIWSATSGFAEMNGFGGSDDEDWLISPAINMNAQSDEYFMFDYNDGFSGALIELYYSVNYNGGNTVTDVQNATWTNIPLTLWDINSLSCFSTLHMRHPAIDVSSINGTSVYFAFKYTGTASSSKNYEIDNINIEADYYNSINTYIQNGGNCAGLKTELYKLVRNYTEVVRYTSSFYDTWDALLTTDRRWNDNATAEIVWDMFTDIPSGTGEFEFDHCNDRDGGSCPPGEGMCYNREHTFPRSWWGSTTIYPTDTINFDMHHITPADREMNTAKLNYPPGEVQVANVTGSNGFKVGTNSAYPCTSMQYFEPINEYKGDYARMYFYIATRYEPFLPSWFGNSTQGDCALDGNTYPGYNSWLMTVLLTWHANDPVSQKEIDRNNAVYAIQGNRNPFIDNPQWVGFIWGDHMGTPCSTLATTCTPNSGSANITACDSYTWPANSITYTISGSYSDTLLNIGGCDSVATINLTVNKTATDSVTFNICNGDNYSYADGTTSSNITSNEFHTSTLTGGAANSCDSIVTEFLNVTTVNTGITSNGDTLTASSSTGTYQWLDCDNNYAIISGATNQQYIAMASGNYAVAISENGCTDTSNCVNVNVIITSSYLFEEQASFSVYPIPTNDVLIIHVKNPERWISYELTTIEGKVLASETLTKNITTINIAHQPAGIYFLNLNGRNNSYKRKIIKY